METKEKQQIEKENGIDFSATVPDGKRVNGRIALNEEIATVTFTGPEWNEYSSVFAFLTVLVTVHAYVFYSLYVVNGNTLMNVTGADSVIHAIAAQGGVYMFGRMMPVWAVIVIEFVIAFGLECIMGSPWSFKLACRVFDPKESHPVIFESTIICATVGLMCPAMSFLAAWFYYPFYQGFSIITLFANWLKLVCFNFPFAFFTQLFFIQPLVRTVFKFLFKK